jgi:hypothetical protein
VIDLARRWTHAEDERLRRDYRAGVPVSSIAAELGRSTDALVARRKLLGIPSRREHRAWSMLEDRLLRASVRSRIPATMLAGRLRRSVEQIRARRRHLGLATPAGRRYSATEDALLLQGWEAGASVDALARQLRRSPDAVRLRAAQIGLHGPAGRRRWTVVEDAVVRSGYAEGHTCRRIADALGIRTEGAVAARARKLGLATYARAWTRTDDERLRRLIAQRSVADTARALSRTPEAVRIRARRLGLAGAVCTAPARAGARWTATEDDVLRLHAELHPGALAVRLGRSDGAVATRMRKLGLRDGRERSPHHPAVAQGEFTAGELRLIDRELPTATGRALLSLADRLNRSPASIAELRRQQSRAARTP